ncbi:MAG: hypothetical protein A3I44_02265 [Candidatus Sungbacteria bacterium RIFCSPLOWO2_02_FULL_51_17]|uniref:Uncharacterized protein n=1 Tax=Candidatus Sungbacteria bacterium RIFCSPHIGHO2_02_FULL_51_29 TaxID=1802273 RepID=A0A1G2KY34_9BACT|nr:MAG: hypothetical protein A2676_01940 [Candidatus Sungbacteria bacterium RIFCSPHIGHO2_01_FULL_51_22]OHA04104.1 MAG: hypothetical protein A3C16_02140 [Candidatus Sungbacteria bacterium RIFCSPHIGHO2_02_FULL_51_29]OHA04756.1 MAG: hypothetical protein A3B29_01460 [Candidatus Sungbacteria bacterium RIFCSPLOWO2_01_FULL_51_34]OHA12018.1 MAG: hypothetical protein A3I44_02265 [Candidatus Sungbacteria bacterium RIFCSPLOWO2_02_FULL_51_17]
MNDPANETRAVTRYVKDGPKELVLTKLQKIQTNDETEIAQAAIEKRRKRYLLCFEGAALKYFKITLNEATRHFPTPEERKEFEDLVYAQAARALTWQLPCRALGTVLLGCTFVGLLWMDTLWLSKNFPEYHFVRDRAWHREKFGPWKTS